MSLLKYLHKQRRSSCSSAVCDNLPSSTFNFTTVFIDLQFPVCCHILSHFAMRLFITIPVNFQNPNYFIVDDNNSIFESFFAK